MTINVEGKEDTGESPQLSYGKKNIEHCRKNGRLG